MEFYVYITTNLINGKQYIGDHSIFAKNEKYMGSGIALYEAFKKYGVKNFQKEILEWFETREEAFLSQEKYIKIYKTHVSQGGYNISWKGGLGINGCHSEESKIKISNSKKGKRLSEETKRKISEKFKDIWKEDQYKNKIQQSLIGKNLGKHRSEEIKEKLKQSSINKNKGRKHSEETKLKMKNSWKIRKQKLLSNI